MNNPYLTNSYGADLNALREIAKKNMGIAFLLDLVVARRHNAYQVKVMSCEKWNRPSEQNNWQASELANPDTGLFDVEGHRWCDVHLEFSLWPLWKWRNLKAYARQIVYGVKTWGEFINLRSLWGLKHTLSCFKTFVLEALVPRVDEAWIWVIDSFESVKSDMAEEQAGDYKSGQIKPWLQVVETKRSQITREDIVAYLAKDYAQITEYMWVNKTDPTCMIVDNTTVPFGLKDGYTDHQIFRFIKLWAWWMFGIPLRIPKERNG